MLVRIISMVTVSYTHLGGSYCPPPPLLRALRQAVHDNIDEFRSIVEDQMGIRDRPRSARWSAVP